jgi:starvation-inducible DNA-binding protein
MAMNTGLDQRARTDIAEKLGVILDATYSLMIRTHIYHWNVKGPLFEPLHELTEKQYKALFAATDVIAERIRQLGFRAPASGEDPFPSGVFKKDEETAPQSMIEDLLACHEKACRTLREAGISADEAGDLVTVDMLSEHLAFHEKAAWMLRSMLDERPDREVVDRA